MLTYSDLQKISYYLTVSLKYDEIKVDDILNYLVLNSRIYRLDVFFGEFVLFNITLHKHLHWFVVYQLACPSSNNINNNHHES